jgi:hypothetical protein
MKKHSAFFALLICAVFSACSFMPSLDIQKRHYRKGFYFNNQKAVSAAENSFVSTADVATVADSNLSIPSAEDNHTLSTVKQNDTVTNSVVVFETQKMVHRELKKNRNVFVKHEIIPKKIVGKKAEVPGWLSDTAMVLLFMLVCFIVPPYWFYFLGIVYILAKNKKKASFLLLTGLVDTAGLALVIALLIAGSPLLLPVYLVTAGLGLIGLALVLIRYFTL